MSKLSRKINLAALVIAALSLLSTGAHAQTMKSDHWSPAELLEKAKHLRELAAAGTGAYDGTFGITSPIYLDEVTPWGCVVRTLEVPNNLNENVRRESNQLVTSFSSKSELALTPQSSLPIRAGRAISGLP